MGKKVTKNLYIENISLDNFNEYIENDLIEKLSQRGILFFNDKYSKAMKILGYDKIEKKIRNTFDLGDKFRGGFIKVNKNEIQCSLHTYKKFGILMNIIDLIIDRNTHEYQINILMTAHNPNKGNNGIELVFGPDKKLPITRNKLLYILFILLGFFLVFIAILTILFPPIFIILVLCLILGIISLPLIILVGIRERRFVKNGRNQLMEIIQDIIESDFKVVEN